MSSKAVICFHHRRHRHCKCSSFLSAVVNGTWSLVLLRILQTYSVRLMLMSRFYHSAPLQLILLVVTLFFSACFDCCRWCCNNSWDAWVNAKKCRGYFFAKQCTCENDAAKQLSIVYLHNPLVIAIKCHYLHFIYSSASSIVATNDKIATRYTRVRQ